jgi:RNA polymerase sigma-70 factor (ECF subfamily)
MSAEVSRQRYLECQRVWPGVALSPDIFARHCERAQAVASDESQREWADLYLCCACAAGNVEALRVFESTLARVAKHAIAKVNRNPDFVEEALQELWKKLMAGPDPKLNQYSGRGPLKAWVRVAAMRLAFDLSRSHGLLIERQVELSDELRESTGSPESALMRIRYGDAFQQALREAVSRLPAQERNVLRMHIAGRCSIDEIGRTYNVHRATAARWLDRSRDRIYQAVRVALGARGTRVTESEFKSLARTLGGALELSLTFGSTRSSLTTRNAEV